MADETEREIDNLEDSKAGLSPGMRNNASMTTEKNNTRLFDKACSICTDDFKPGETITVTPCGHSFHDQCI